MSQRPIVLDPDIRKLQEEGYEVEVLNGHLLVHSIPYVTSQETIAYGIVVTDLNGTIGQLGQPKDHQVWFAGEFPCYSTGAPIEALRHSAGQSLWTGFDVQYRFSNKPENGFQDYYSKMKSYISIISNEAKVINPDVTPCTFKVIIPTEELNSVFKYYDSASSRANIIAVSEKLAMEKVAIVGLGGTGSYVLDLVAKTQVREIHLFDGKSFDQHCAFRAPGAASIEILETRPAKVDYYAGTYEKMRHGIVPHNVFISRENADLLAEVDFVFLCVDTGQSRKVISTFLRERNIPFVDVGMDLQLLTEANQLIGTCRTTLVTREKIDHFDQFAPQGMDTDEDLYRSNIQVADMNALNAAFAVMKWKQLCGFYRDHFEVHHSTFSIDSHSLTRDITKNGELY